MEKRRFLILMSTYNGEMYLREQLDSIFSQEGVEVNLLVRDDGSTDSTLSILREYREKHPGRMRIDEGENIGWKKSFHRLIQTGGKEAGTYDFFAFADQDDIWLPEKLRKGSDELLKLEAGAALYCGNQYYYKDGEVHGLVNKESRKPTEKGCLVRNHATGCTIVFNRDLMNILGAGMPDYGIAHDYWVYMVGVLCGRVVIDDCAYIWYRQHDSNQIGSKTGWRATWRRRLRSVKALVGEHYRERVAKELLRLHSSHMTESGRRAVEGIANYRRSLSDRINLLKDAGYTLENSSGDFWLKVRVILGRL